MLIDDTVTWTYGPQMGLTQSFARGTGKGSENLALTPVRLPRWAPGLGAVVQIGPVE
jgi:hypothetical protein